VERLTVLGVQAFSTASSSFGYAGEEGLDYREAMADLGRDIEAVP
jgi:hypothetical protein